MALTIFPQGARWRCLAAGAGFCIGSLSKAQAQLDLGDTLWIDVDGDSMIDAGEARMGGVKVELIAANGVTVIDTDTTDASGNYLFDVPDDGATYSVEIDETTLPYTGLVNTSDRDGDEDGDSSQFTMAGVDVFDIDFGYQLSGDYDIFGTVFNDRDSSGSWQYRTEPTYYDVTVDLCFTRTAAPLGSRSLPGRPI
jgi:hypothetical protein